MGFTDIWFLGKGTVVIVFRKSFDIYLIVFRDLNAGLKDAVRFVFGTRKRLQEISVTLIFFFMEYLSDKFGELTPFIKYRFLMVRITVIVCFTVVFISVFPLSDSQLNIIFSAVHR